MNQECSKEFLSSTQNLQKTELKKNIIYNLEEIKNISNQTNVKLILREIKKLIKDDLKSRNLNITKVSSGYYINLDYIDHKLLLHIDLLLRNITNINNV